MMIWQILMNVTLVTVVVNKFVLIKFLSTVALVTMVTDYIRKNFAQVYFMI